MPSGKVQRRLIVFQNSVGGPAISQKEFDRPRIVAGCHTDNARGSVVAQAAEKGGMLLENSLGHSLIADFCGHDQTKPRGATLHEEIENTGMSELMRDHMG